MEAAACAGSPAGSRTGQRQSGCYRLAGYRAGIAGIGMTPEQMGGEYSTALRITPARVRVY